ncbi:MAG: HAMP domain-containing sensor histidine kinase [Anaerolineae bacterium]
MTPAAFERLLSALRITYAITDGSFHIADVGGASSPYLCLDHLGMAISDVMPELTGYESLLVSISDGRAPQLELPWINREMGDAQTVYLRVSLQAHRGVDGASQGLFVTLEDVTPQGVAQQQVTHSRNQLRLLRDELAQRNLALEAANTELHHLDDLKSQFIEVAAHELRTPLTTLSGFLEMLLEELPGPLTSEQRRYLRIMDESAQRLQAIVNELLELTRIDAGRLQLTLQPADIVRLARDVIVNFEPQVTARNLHLRLDAEAHLPMTLCDVKRTVQILSNLVSNAVKYTLPGGQIIIHVGPASEPYFVEVTVVDDGVGIPVDEQPRVFDRFFRARTAGLTDAPGTGLGLSIARSLAELHGGRIWLESEVGHGSKFHVTLPAIDLVDDLP